MDDHLDLFLEIERSQNNRTTTAPPQYKRQSWNETVKELPRGEQRLNVRRLARQTNEEAMIQKIPAMDQAVPFYSRRYIDYGMEWEGRFVSFPSEIMSVNRIKQETITAAKLPRPVDINKKLLIQDQAAINLNDKSFTQLSDLSFSDQQDVLGTSNILSMEAPDKVSLIDVPEDGYDFRAIMRKDELDGQDIMGEFVATRGRGFSTRVSKAPFVLPSSDRSFNYIELNRRANANALYQDNLFNTNY